MTAAIAPHPFTAAPEAASPPLGRGERTLRRRAEERFAIAQVDPLRVHVASSASEVHAAWRLVYRAYRAGGLVDANDMGIHLVPQSIQPRSVVLLGRRGALLCSTVSCYEDQGSGLPLDAVYAEELNAFRSRGLRLFETGMLADRPGSPAHRPHELFELMRHPFYYGLWAGLSDMVIGVHPRHAPFYERLIGFEAVGAERTYGLVRDHPVVMLKLDLKAARAMARPPRGLQYFIDHPVADPVFEGRFPFRPDAVESSLRSYVRFLAWQAEGQRRSVVRAPAA